MKQGQLSVFLILAIVIAISIGFVITLAKLAAPRTAVTPISDTNTHLRLCLEDAGKIVILSAMKQGGVNTDKKPGWQGEWGSASRTTYDTTGTPPRGEAATNDNPPYSGGRSPPKPYVDTVSGPVRIWVQRGKDYVPGNYVKKNKMSIDLNDPSTYSPLGNFTFEPLCSFSGANKPTFGSVSCMAGTYNTFVRPSTEPEYLSMQEKMERDITALVQADDYCKGSPPVQMTLGENDVTLTAGNESVALPIKLKRMYNAAYWIARNDIANPDFNVANVKDHKNLKYNTFIPGCNDPKYGIECLIPGFTVQEESAVADPSEALSATDQSALSAIDHWKLPSSAYEEPDPDKWVQDTQIVDIIDTDPNSKIDNKNPVFRIAIKNRYPIIPYTSTPPTISILEDANHPAVWMDGSLSAFDPDDTAMQFACTWDNPKMRQCGNKLATDPAKEKSNSCSSVCSANMKFESSCPSEKEPSISVCNRQQAAILALYTDPDKNVRHTFTDPTPSPPFQVVFCSVGPGGLEVPNTWWNLDVTMSVFPRNCRRLDNIHLSTTCHYDQPPDIDPVPPPTQDGCTAYTCDSNYDDPIAYKPATAPSCCDTNSCP